MYATRGDVPATVTHRISATFAPAGADENAFTRLFPAQATEVGGLVTTSPQAPVVIGPPVAGNWYADNACCTLTSHRGAMLPLGGRINGAERYAIDYTRLDINAQPLIDVKAGTIATFTGDRNTGVAAPLSFVILGRRWEGSCLRAAAAPGSDGAACTRSERSPPEAASAQPPDLLTSCFLCARTTDAARWRR